MYNLFLLFSSHIDQFCANPFFIPNWQKSCQKTDILTFDTRGVTLLHAALFFYKFLNTCSRLCFQHQQVHSCIQIYK